MGKRLTRADYDSLIKAGYQLEPYKDLCNKDRDDYEEMLRTAKLKTLKTIRFPSFSVGVILFGEETEEMPSMWGRNS